MIPFQPKKQYTTIALYAGATIAAIILFGALIFHFSNVLGAISDLIATLSPFLYGLVFAYFLRPLVVRFERLFFKAFRIEKRPMDKKRVRLDAFIRMLSLVCTYIFLGILLYLFIFHLLPLLVGDGRALGNRLLGLVGTLVDMVNQIGGLFGFSITVTDLTAFIADSKNTIIEAVTSFGVSLSATLFDVFVGLFLSAGILYHRHGFLAHTRRFGVAVCSFRVFRYLRRTLNYANEVFGKYIIGKIVECSIIGLLYLIILPIIRIPYPFLITIIMTITNFIPIIGAILGGIPCGILILTGENPFMAFWFILLVLAIEQIDGNIVFPKVIGSIINLRAVWIMIAVALFGGIFGVLGMFLSVPIFSVLYMLIRDGIDHLLKKKKRVTDTEFYADLFATSATPRRRRLRNLFKRKTAHGDESRDSVSKGEQER